MLSFIWSIKEDLRGPYKPHQYGQVILPMLVLRRLDATLASFDPREPTRTRKQAVLDRTATLAPPYDSHVDLLKRTAGLEFYNTSKFDFGKVLGDQEAVLDNFMDYLVGFSPEVREVVAAFGFASHVERLARAGRLYAVLGRFADAKLDLSPDKVSNLDMGYIYEELLREVNALQKETAGEHFTPREVIDLMVGLLVSETDDLLTDGKVITVYDPAAGTGGMLTTAEMRLLALNSKLHVHLRGQEIQEESFALCRSDMLIRGEQTADIRLGDTLKKDLFAGERFDYVLANPPYGMDWRNALVEVTREHKNLGMAGRFGPGLPSTDDGQMLFLLHMFSKLRTPAEGGGRLAVVMNGSPLFAGEAGSGPSEIRRFFIENDYLEAVIGLPPEMFYNTPISTYIWVASNRKRPEREGLVQLIDARDLFSRMPKSLGNKRNRFSRETISEILAIYETFIDTDRSRILKNDEFGFRAVTIERPLRLAWMIDEPRLAVLGGDPTVAKLPDEARESVLGAFGARVGWLTREEAVAEQALDELLAGVHRPNKALRDKVRKIMETKHPEGALVRDKNGPKPDKQRRETELVPLTMDVTTYFEERVRPHAPETWVSSRPTKIGFEIPFARIFYRYKPPRPLAEIDADIAASQRRILALLGRVEG
jgi:type I restriction enzyme M protein